MRVENRSRSAFPDRSADGLRASFEELAAMVASSRTWGSALAGCRRLVRRARCEREAVGQDGEHYTRGRGFIVGELRDGRVASMCEFELDDEDAAFAYAEERVRATTSRLAVTNRASENSRSNGRGIERQ